MRKVSVHWVKSCKFAVWTWIVFTHTWASAHVSTYIHFFKSASLSLKIMYKICGWLCVYVWARHDHLGFLSHAFLLPCRWSSDKASILSEGRPIFNPRPSRVNGVKNSELVTTLPDSQYYGATGRTFLPDFGVL